MNRKNVILGIVGIILIGCLTLTIPWVRERVVWRVDQLRIYLRYTFFPPEEAVFIPQDGSYKPPTLVKSATQTEIKPTSTSTPRMEEPKPDRTHTPTKTVTPTVTSLPSSILLEGVVYEDQHGLWNYCAPANLAMALSYWGVESDRLTIGSYLKPEEDDKNVMPYEMADYVQTQTNLAGIVRQGGTVNLLKMLLAKGFPVLIEKGVVTRETLSGRMTWMGHYAVLIGYDDAANHFISRDSYYSPPDYPLDFPIDYDQIVKEWRGFNYIYMVIYPVDRQDEVLRILGDYADEDYSFQVALTRADDEIATLSGLDRFFAQFNRGTNLVKLFDYGNAAEAYDRAFEWYAELPKEVRPYRVMWYQTGPYFAYYYTNRFQDVIDLASTTINAADKPYLEESWYWRGLAKIASGDVDGGVDDLRASLKYHPGFEPSLQKLQDLGVSQ